MQISIVGVCLGSICCSISLHESMKDVFLLMFYSGLLGSGLLALFGVNLIKRNSGRNKVTLALDIEETKDHKELIGVIKTGRELPEGMSLYDAIELDMDEEDINDPDLIKRVNITIVQPFNIDTGRALI